MVGGFVMSGMDRMGEEFAVGDGAAEVAGVGEATLGTVVGEVEG